MENITEECENAGIEYEMDNKRSIGHPIRVKFIGELKEAQVSAVEKLLPYETIHLLFVHRRAKERG